jgi:hypothetical protein
MGNKCRGGKTTDLIEFVLVARPAGMRVGVVAVRADPFGDGDLRHAPTQKRVDAAGRLLRHGAQYDELPRAVMPVILPPFVDDESLDAGRSTKMPNAVSPGRGVVIGAMSSRVEFHGGVS